MFNLAQFSSLSHRMASLSEPDGVIDFEIVEATPGNERRQELKDDLKARELELMLEATRRENTDLQLKVERLEKESSRTKRVENELWEALNAARDENADLKWEMEGLLKELNNDGENGMRPSPHHSPIDPI